jgi:hypothetical protein
LEYFGQYGPLERYQRSPNNQNKNLFIYSQTILPQKAIIHSILMSDAKIMMKSVSLGK